MFKKTLVSMLLYVASASPAFADCVDIIKAASLRGTVVEGSSSIDQEARAFCNEYSSAKQQGRAFNGGVSYAGIGVSAGASSQSIEQTASKYCDSTNSYKARASNYERYVETIAPGAFESYNRCVAIPATERVAATLDTTAIHARDIALTVANPTTGKNVETIQYVASPGFVCKWKSGAGIVFSTDRATLPPNTATALQCTRNDEGQEGSITLVTVSRPNANYTFLWKKFQKGMPVDELQQLKNSNNALTSSMTKAIVAFDGSRCPAGWNAVPELAGRTIIGAGTGNGLSPRNLRDVGGEESHKLTITEMPSHTHGYDYTNHQNTPRETDYSPDEFGNSGTEAQTKPSGGDGGHNNMQPFLALTYCARP